MWALFQLELLFNLHLRAYSLARHHDTFPLQSTVLPSSSSLPLSDPPQRLGRQHFNGAPSLKHRHTHKQIQKEDERRKLVVNLSNC